MWNKFIKFRFDYVNRLLKYSFYDSEKDNSRIVTLYSDFWHTDCMYVAYSLDAPHFTSIYSLCFEQHNAEYLFVFI